MGCAYCGCANCGCGGYAFLIGGCAYCRSFPAPRLEQNLFSMKHRARPTGIATPAAMPIVASISSPPPSSRAAASTAAAAAHAHEGCMLSSHKHESAFMSYGVPSRLDFTAFSEYSVEEGVGSEGPSMAQENASICVSVQLA